MGEVKHTRIASSEASDSEWQTLVDGLPAIETTGISVGEGALMFPAQSSSGERWPHQLVEDKSVGLACCADKR